MTNNEILQTLQALNTMYLQYTSAKLDLLRAKDRTEIGDNNLKNLSEVTQHIQDTHDAIFKLYQELP